MKPVEEMELLQNAVLLAQEGHREEARILLEKILQANPHLEMAWLWLVETVDKPALRVSILRECLRHNPDSKFAKDGLALLASEGVLDADLSQLVSAALSDAPPPTRTKRLLANGMRPAAENPAGQKLPVVPMTIGCFLLVVIISVGSLLGGFVVIPVINGHPPAVSVPAPMATWIAPFLTQSATPIQGLLVAMKTATPAVTKTHTPTVFTTPTEPPAPTFSPTVTPTFASTETPTTPVAPTPTLFVGNGLLNTWNLRFLAAGGCIVQSVPIVGGNGKIWNANPPANCAHARLSLDGSRMAYIGQPDQASIHLVNVDGTGSRRLLQLEPYEKIPLTIWGIQWSPFGSQVAYIAPRYGLKDGVIPYVDTGSIGWLYSLPTDGSAPPKKVDALGVERRFADQIRWSPDGKWILVMDHRDVAQGLGYYPYAYRASDSLYVMMANLDFKPEANARFDWSPDSRYVSHLVARKPTEYDCVSTTAPEDQTYLIIAGLSGIPGLEHEPTRQCIALAQQRAWSLEFGARWSPDSKSFLLYDGGSNSLVTIAHDGSKMLPILPLARAPLYAEWSPDGIWIAFIEEGASKESGILEVVHSDGTDRRVLAYDVAPDMVVWNRPQ
jgi:hypothetical protein